MSQSQLNTTDRIDRLERQVLVLKAILCCLLAALAVIAAMASGLGESTIRAKRIELSSPEGSLGLILSGDPQSGIVLLDSEGNTRGRLHLDAANQPGLFLQGENAGMGLAFSGNGTPALEMRSSGVSRLTLGLAGSGSGLALNAANGTPRLTLQSSESTSAIAFGNNHLRLQSDPQNATIQLSGKAGSIKLQTSADTPPLMESTVGSPK